MELPLYPAQVPSFMAPQRLFQEACSHSQFPCHQPTPRGRDEVRPEHEASELSLKIKSAAEPWPQVSGEALVRSPWLGRVFWKVTSLEGGF